MSYSSACIFGITVGLAFWFFFSLSQPFSQNDPQPTAPATSVYPQGRPTE